jgi:hypothetical protein
MHDAPQRLNADLNGTQHGTNIHVPIEVGKMRTVITIILEESGKVHVAGPLNEPSLMDSLLKRARAVVDQYQSTRLVQPVNGVVGLKGSS